MVFLIDPNFPDRGMSNEIVLKGMQHLVCLLREMPCKLTCYKSEIFKAYMPGTGRGDCKTGTVLLEAGGRRNGRSDWQIGV